MGFRGYGGPIVSGVVERGDDVLLRPARQTTRVKSIVERRDGATAERDYALAPMSITLTLDDEIDVWRGDMLVHPRKRCWCGPATAPWTWASLTS
jgi:sulfate adenylyltransferase subunit 1 (EFTu-like GTPase family)